MKPLIPSPTNTNHTSADSYSADRELAKRLFHELEAFQDDLKISKMMAKDNGEVLPMIEAPRHLLEYYNKGTRIEHVDKVGYFIMDEVAICEVGKKEEVLERMSQSSRDVFQVMQEQAEMRAEAKEAAKTKKKL